MGDTDFFGRVGEFESLQDAYDSRIAEMVSSDNRMDPQIDIKMTLL